VSSLTKQNQRRKDLHKEFAAFKDFGKATRELELPLPPGLASQPTVPMYVNEFWTAKQRAGNALHEVSYRACFKPQLPKFFIERLTSPGDRVYDPFLGRGTTAIEAALLGRVPLGCDINPLSIVLTRPRLTPPLEAQVPARLAEIDLTKGEEFPPELLVFYHPETLVQLTALRRYFLDRTKSGTLDSVDEWIRMVAVNRLTGHSNGFFSVYTLPPNQAVSAKAQEKINRDRNQVPPVREVPKLIAKKSRGLLKELDDGIRATLASVRGEAQFITANAAKTPQIESNSVTLVVTSPPFLDIVDYKTDNWLRCWFLGIDTTSVAITSAKKIEEWQRVMTSVFRELYRVLKPGGHIAFEVGEVRGGTIKLEETVLHCGLDAGLNPELILINDQEFTKTANCWGVSNMNSGTNTNRIVLFEKTDG
jgi:hypothetical protein